MVEKIYNLLFGIRNPWIDLSKQEPPKDCGIIWGKYTNHNPVTITGLSGKIINSNYGLVLRLPDGKWVHGWQNASEPYVYLNVTHWKLKL